MDGYENNEAINAHIWNYLAQADTEYVLDQTNIEQEPLPQLNTEWLTSKESSSRQEQQINDEVLRRVRSEQMATEQELQQAEKDWTQQVYNSENEAEEGINQTPQLVLSGSESDGEAEMFSPRRTRKSKRIQPLRKTKTAINYKDMFAMFSSEADISPRSSSSIYQSDMDFLSTLDLTTSEFKSTSVTYDLKKHVHLSKENTYENTSHPLAFTAKVQSHQSDIPTYSDILWGSEDKRKLWDASMIKELQSLSDLGLFRMVRRPSGSNVLQSTWVYKKKRYPDESLKKHKSRFCVRGDHQIEGVDVFQTYAPLVS